MALFVDTCVYMVDRGGGGAMSENPDHRVNCLRQRINGNREHYVRSELWYYDSDCLWGRVRCVDIWHRLTDFA